MMGVTGLTENKLFKVRTLNPNNLYQVGVNGVLEVSDPNDGQVSVKYEIDDIVYTSFISESIVPGSTQGFTKIPHHTKGKKEYLKLNYSDPYTTLSRGTFTRESIPGTDGQARFSKYLGNGETVNKFHKPKTVVPTLPNGGDTIYVTKNFSYDQFVINNIVKQEKYVGLIDHPIVESDLFIERDEYTIFERHQRLSEINNLATLQNYRGGYFKNIKTL
jgi:hypothetical protein